jgi:hypothetical protein
MAILPRLGVDLDDYVRLPRELVGEPSRWTADWWAARRVLGRIGASYVISAAGVAAGGEVRVASDRVRVVWARLPARWPMLLLILPQAVMALVRRLAAFTARRERLDVVKPSVSLEGGSSVPRLCAGAEPLR